MTNPLEIGHENKEQKSKNILTWLVLVLLCAAIALQLYQQFTKEPTPNEIYQKSINFIVEIKSTYDGDHEGFGTGVVYNNEGLIVTNYHVVTYTKEGEKKPVDQIECRFADEEEYSPLELVTFDENNDIAILKFTDNSHSIKCTEVYKENDLKHGDKVYAVGNTSNYGISISEGIISVPLVEIEYSNQVRDVIQCDLTIAEGNSGGALLDSKGRLIGITTFRTKDKNGNIIFGIAYCVPVDIIEKLINSIV